MIGQCLEEKFFILDVGRDCTFVYFVIIKMYAFVSGRFCSTKYQAYFKATETNILFS